MKIAVVTPYVARVFGNRAAFAVARELAREHEVTVHAHTVDQRVLGEVERLLAPAKFTALHTTSIRCLSMSRLLWWQLSRGSDRALARALEQEHARAPLDVVIVVADEGHWLGGYVRQWSARTKPITVLCVLELLDHSFLLGYDRPWANLRRLAAPVYPLVHAMEARRLAAFDRLTSISRWTSELLDYLYGLPSAASLAVYDDRLFQISGSAAVPEGAPYLAVPTAALDARSSPVIARLHANGVPLRTFGPRPVPGVPHEGFLADEEMVRLLAGARATLFLFDYEALGLLPIESLAVGTPVITYPRQGPHAEHWNNPNVRFATSYPEIRATAQELLERPKDRPTIEACERSVAEYRPAAVVSRLLPLLHPKRD